MPEVHASPKDPRTSLGPQEASASGEKLAGSPQAPGAFGVDVEGGGKWFWGEGVWGGGSDMDKDGG